MTLNRSLLTLFTLLLTTFLLLSYGNCQWGKWVYRWQVEVWPGGKRDGIDPPEDYTGEWTFWYKSGEKHIGLYNDGLDIGITRRWWPNGQLRDYVDYDNFKRRTPNYSLFESGSLREWHANSVASNDLINIDGNLHITWDPDGTLTLVTTSDYSPDPWVAGPSTNEVVIYDATSGVDITIQLNFTKLTATEFMTKHGITAEVE